MKVPYLIIRPRGWQAEARDVLGRLHHRYPQGMEPFNASAVTSSVGAWLLESLKERNNPRRDGEANNKDQECDKHNNDIGNIFFFHTIILSEFLNIKR